MSDLARNLKRFLEDNSDSNMPVDQLVGLFFAQHPLSNITTREDLAREVKAVEALIRQANFDKILRTLGL